MLTEVQTAFLEAKFPPQELKRIREKLRTTLPGVKKIKVRSSANAEDVPNFDGAGLHDSFSAKTGKDDDGDEHCRFDDDSDSSDTDKADEVKRKVKPRNVSCAIKGVYASLWNQRAIEERNFARIDPASVAMGIAVVPSYDEESDIAANAVVVTRVLNTKDVYGYTVSVQQGNNLVTNPDPGTFSEVTIAGFVGEDEPTSLTVTRYAKPTKTALQRTEPVLDRTRMLTIVDLARKVEQAWCEAKPSYYGNDCEFVTADPEKPASLDLELKVLENGRFVCKQVREFGGR
jgi:phosphoenolpyruvate synthase/pyruvate phosphate dikinase